MYKHYSLLLAAAAAILHHTNAGLVWSVPNGITMPIAKRYSTRDLIFDLRRGRNPQYIDKVGCQDFLVNPTLYNRDISSGWDNGLQDFSQFDGSTNTLAQLPAGAANQKQYHPNCYTASYSSDNPLVGRDNNQPPDYNNLDVLSNANPSPAGETRSNPWADFKASNFGTNLGADNPDTGTAVAYNTPLPGQNLVASAQTGAYDVPAPLQDTLVMTGGQDIKLPSPGTDSTITPYDTAYDTTLPLDQATDITNPTLKYPGSEQQPDNFQTPDIPCSIPEIDPTVLKVLSSVDGFKINCDGQVFLAIGEQSPYDRLDKLGNVHMRVVEKRGNDWLFVYPSEKGFGSALTRPKPPPRDIKQRQAIQSVVRPSYFRELGLG